MIVEFVDATGHDVEGVKIVQKKLAGSLMTPSGKIKGEKTHVQTGPRP